MFSALLLTLLSMPPHVDAVDEVLAAPTGIPTLPWLDDGNQTPQPFQGPPLATVSTTRGDPAAQIWGAVDSKALHLHIEVHDANHLNTQHGTQIWDGDAVQIGVDARGHGAAGLAKDADFVAIGDLYAAFALTSDGGIQGWAHLRGAPDATGPLATPSTIVRDDAKALTTYDIVLPWELLHTIPGAYDTLGLSVQINNADPHAPREHIQWGGGPSGTLRPGLLQRVAYDKPPEGYVDAMLADSDLWRPDDAPELIVVHHTSGTTTVRSTWSGQEEAVTLASAPAPTRSRLHARSAAWTEAPQTWLLHVPLDEARTRDFNVAVRTPPLEFAKVAEQLATLSNEATGPLIARHVRTVTSIVHQAWQAGLTLLPANPDAARDVLQTAQHLLPTLTQTCHNPNAFAQGQAALLDTFVSADDDSLQPYSVRLPRHWDPNTAHPLIVFLHGKGDPQVAHFLDNAITSTSAPERDAIVLMPWGRGIYGYKDMAEHDVLSALESVRATFNIDPDRVYLGGFSMGGAGAWNMALHVPAPWAAISISSGGTWLTSLGVGLGVNAKDVPLQIWHGDADGAVDVNEAYAMRDEAKRTGIKADVTIARGGGHVFDDAHWRRMVDWLLPHRRAAVQSFTYVVDDFAHRGRSGIKLFRDTRMAPFPRMRVHIDKQRTVTLETQGTPGVDVDLGPSGLGLTGDVTLIWNGKKVYTGPVRDLTLGSGGGAR